MITFQTVYVVALVSQATSALLLTLLAFGDRRARGLVSLAVACSLHAGAIWLMHLWRGGTNRWFPQAISSALLPFIFFLIFQGLRSLIRSQGRASLAEWLPVGAVMGVIVALAPSRRLWSLQVACIAAVCLIAWTARLLWAHRTAGVRLPARITASLLLVILATFLVRIPLEPLLPVPAVMLPLRELTMSGITLLAFSFFAVYLAESKRRLHLETRVDALTGLDNRRAMEERAARGIRLAQHNGKPLALLMMDLDAFKLLNDTWGHGVGDRALREVGAVLLSTKLPDSTVARLGGEEFAMLLPDHTLIAAQTVAEQLRLAIAGLVVLEGSRRVSFTVSMGVAAWHAGEIAWTEMLARADAALYRAKREGRNRVVLFSDPTLPGSPERHGQRPRNARSLVGLQNGQSPSEPPQSTPAFHEVSGSVTPGAAATARSTQSEPQCTAE